MTETCEASQNEYGDCANCDGCGLVDCGACDAGVVYTYYLDGLMITGGRCLACKGHGQVACPSLPHPITTD